MVNNGLTYWLTWLQTNMSMDQTKDCVHVQIAQTHIYIYKNVKRKCCKQMITDVLHSGQRTNNIKKETITWPAQEWTRRKFGGLCALARRPTGRPNQEQTRLLRGRKSANSTKDSQISISILHYIHLANDSHIQLESWCKTYIEQCQKPPIGLLVIPIPGLCYAVGVASFMRIRKFT